MTDDTLPFDSVEPQKLGHYRVVRKLAEGGMGEVFSLPSALSPTS